MRLYSMKCFFINLSSLLLLANFSTAIAKVPPPSPGEYHVAYEMAVFNPEDESQRAGTHLNGPGDSYRYTYFIDDKYINDDQYLLKSASIGIHIVDSDYTEKTGDSAKEWGKILIDGKPRFWEHFPSVKKYRAGLTPEFTDLLEMSSDDEMGGMPPYIFDVTADLKDDRKLVIEVINLRQDGSIEGKASFGDFNVLRAGLHLYYAKK